MADAKTLDDILQGRFIKRVLSTAVHDINLAQVKYMSGHGFDNPDWVSERDFIASESALEYSQLLKHRFVDMRTRNTKEGKVKKKSHPIHNKMIFGHYNNIIRELTVGYTDAVKDELRQLES